ncbi:invasion associated locus B family protein [Methylorubrum aminovorans]|nr:MULTISPECIES: invasion associated locus B family protein [unclassified Methylobacterium]QIJ75616.1 invasion associated locus B family protein [Methylobacterium sp. CLZ]QIJ80520.1 invasion associated locus B family protein [Methylobacterium sp. NI91]
MPPLSRGTAPATAFLLAGMMVLAWPGLAPAQEDAATEAAPAEPAAKPKPRPRKPAPKKEEAKESAPPAPSGTVLEPAAAASSSQWPAGASSVSESYGDWTMNCNRAEARTDCVIIQSQGDRRTGKRLFSVELRPPRDGKSEGLILMPFGLQIEPGVSFKLDDRQLGKGAPFSYCVTDGCLVPISLPTLATDAMKTATNLTISATKPDAKEPTIITVPLSGFAAAFARASAFGS